MHVLLKELSERHRPAVLLVTHDVDEAIELADRVVVLEEGKVAADIVVDLPQSGPERSIRFAHLRRQLLGRLGVVDGLAEPAPAPLAANA
jgi:sulfonate transport system ATP-binding protein